MKPGPTRRVHANKTRGAAFCGMGAFVGVGKTQRAHVYTAATLPVGPVDYKRIDPEKLAKELEVVQCAVNSGRSSQSALIERNSPWRPSWKC